MLHVSNTEMRLQNLAVPHLYRHPYITDEYRLSRFSWRIMTTSADHPRLAWVKALTVEMTTIFSQDPFGHSELKLSDSISDVITRLQPLDQLFIDGIPLRSENIKAFATSSGHSLSSLSVDITFQNMQTLHTIATCMTRLHSLALCFHNPKSRYPPDIQNGCLNLSELPPLRLPRVSSLKWSWKLSMADLATPSSFQYLASCRFANDCNLSIEYTDALAHLYTATLDPLFIQHNSRLVSLSCTIPETSTVMVNAPTVEFVKQVPPPQLFDVPNLPSLITFSHVARDNFSPIYRILDRLVASMHAHDTRICIIFDTETLCGSWSLAKDGPYINHLLPVFSWDTLLPGVHHPVPEAVKLTYKLAEYAQILAPRGIIIADWQMKTLPRA
jgi:hypothetical protein